MAETERVEILRGTNIHGDHAAVKDVVTVDKGLAAFLYRTQKGRPAPPKEKPTTNLDDDAPDSKETKDSEETKDPEEVTAETKAPPEKKEKETATRPPKEKTKGKK